MGAQIKKEISIMKSVAHPNVVAIREVFATTSKIFIVLELVGGGELFEYLLDRKRLPEAEARHFLQQLVQGLSYCHGNGIFHRDLKPENLLLDLQGNIKISDFGLSTLYVGSADSSGDRLELLHTTCGTPNYVAPEVLENRGYDGRNADVWSLGIILFVLVAGYLPFEEDTMPGLFDKIKRAEFQMPACDDAGGAPAGDGSEPSSPSRRANPYARARSCSPQREKEKEKEGGKDVRFSVALIALLENILVADPRRRWSLAQVGASAWMQGPTLAPTHISNKSQLAISPQRAQAVSKRKGGSEEEQDGQDENADPNQRRRSRSRASSSNPLHVQEEGPLPAPPLPAEKRGSSATNGAAVGPPIAAAAVSAGPSAAEATVEVEMREHFGPSVPQEAVVLLEECALLTNNSKQVPPVNACCTIS